MADICWSTSTAIGSSQAADFAGEAHPLHLRSDVAAAFGRQADRRHAVGRRAARCQPIHAEDGVSAATLVELFRPPPLVRELPQYLSRVLEISRRRCLRA